jgi:sulfide:quinone oxidoreductase
MKRILILGGGFGGLVAAEKLSEKFDGEHQITLVAPQRKFTFYPGLVRFVFGELEEDDITFDLAGKLHKLNVRFVEGEVLHLKPELHRVQVAGKEFNGHISYDYLVIAMGRRLATEKIPGFFEHAHHLVGIRAAAKFGKAVEDFKHGEIVIGLAPNARLPVPVCETAFAMSKRIEDSPINPTNITVVFPEDVNDAFGGAEIVNELKESPDKRNIE